MQDRFETTFVVEMSPAATWSVIATGERSSERWWLPGFEATTEVVSVDAGRELHARKIEEPCAGTEIIVTVEASETGTKVTVVQSGFDPGFLAAALEAVSIGWSHIAADFVLYVQRGVRGGRHLRPWAMFGCSVEERPTGLEVGAVWGGFAERAGMVPGDILLTVAGAPVVTRRELETVMRVVPTGNEIEATWAHDRELAQATAPL